LGSHILFTLTKQLNQHFYDLSCLSRSVRGLPCEMRLVLLDICNQVFILHYGGVSKLLHGKHISSGACPVAMAYRVE